MITEFKQIENLLKEMESYMEEKVQIYIIGGAALLEQGLKPATKDIDMVVATREEFVQVQKALEKYGFDKKN